MKQKMNMKKKLNITVGRFQPFTQGHLNMINECEAPYILKNNIKK